MPERPRLLGSALMVRVVGGFEVRHAGRKVPTTMVGSRKARTLLALLAVQPRAVQLDRIAIALWDNAIPRDPGANIATLVSRLRLAFGPHIIAGDRRGYRLGDQVRVDLHEGTHFVHHAQQHFARNQPRSALASARLAVRFLDNGDVLATEPDVLWAEPARAEHGVLLSRARHVIAEAALCLGDIEAACTATQAAILADPYDEIAYRILMRAHQMAGEPARALIAYQRLRTTLADDLGVAPAPRTRELQAAILCDVSGA